MKKHKTIKVFLILIVFFNSILIVLFPLKEIGNLLNLKDKSPELFIANFQINKLTLSLEKLKLESFTH